MNRMSRRRLARVLFVIGITGVGTFLGILWAPKPAPPKVEYVEVPQQVSEREAPNFDMTVRRDPPPQEEPEEPEVVADEPDPVPAPVATVASTVSPTPPPAPPALKPKIAQPKAAVVAAKKSPTEIRAVALREKINSNKRAIANLQKKLQDDKTNLDMQMQQAVASLQQQFSRSYSSGFPQVRSMSRINSNRRNSTQKNAFQQLQTSANTESAATKAKIESYQTSVNALQAELKSLLEK